MSEWAAKRFWTAAAAVPEGGAWAVRLDGRPVRTPGKAVLALPGAALARAVAAEWDAQGERVDPLSMPLTRAANTTLDKLPVQRDGLIEGLTQYGASDLLSYRADGPPDLAARQAAAWDPLLDWAEARLGARLTVTAGVMPVAQDVSALSALRARVAACTDWELTGLTELVSLSGSLVLGLAVLERRLTPETAWEASRVDETHQIERWGADEEEVGRVARRFADFARARRWLDLLEAGDGEG
jgi:chaperone required for assembly of F1-ATPase